MYKRQQYRHSRWNKETAQEQFKKSAVPQRSFEPKDKDRRPKCYNCGKRGHLQVDVWEKKIPKEGSDRTNWRSKAPEQHTVSTLHKTSGNLIVNGFAEGEQTSFTVEMCIRDRTTAAGAMTQKGRALVKNVVE